MGAKRWNELKPDKLKLDSLKGHFEVFNRSEGKSPKTVIWYNETLKDFIAFLEKEGIPPSLATADEMAVRRYILDLQNRKVHGRPISSHSVNSRVRALRVFYNWLYNQKYTKRNLLEKVRPPKAEEKIVELLTESEIARLFAAFNPNTALGARNIAIIATLLDCGLRRSEAIDLKDEDAKLSDGYVKVMGKGRKERMVTLGSTSQRALPHYHHPFRSEQANPITIANFFLSCQGYPFTSSGLTSMIVIPWERSGVPRLHVYFRFRTPSAICVLFLVVVVKALSEFASEQPSLYHLPQQLWRAEPLPERAQQTLTGVEVDIETGVVGELEGSHGMIQPQLEGLVDIFPAGHALLQDTHALVFEGDQCAGDNEALGVLAHDRFFAEHVRDLLYLPSDLIGCQ
ncbi:MAG: hypothetical protein EPO21_08250 [Chloroflexota bacterium]|nr:MAG: hypothetical protein EPO21_08250 [Chloroflexota bacterium]